MAPLVSPSRESFSTSIYQAQHVHKMMCSSKRFLPFLRNLQQPIIGMVFEMRNSNVVRDFHLTEMEQTLPKLFWGAPEQFNTTRDSAASSEHSSVINKSGKRDYDKNHRNYGITRTPTSSPLESYIPHLRVGLSVVVDKSKSPG